MVFIDRILSFRNGFMQQTRCPICHTPPATEPPPLSIHLCANCGSLWTFIPEEIDPNGFYKDEVYAVVDNRGSVVERIIFREAGRVLQQAAACLPAGKRRLLDFGCGKGQFLAKAKSIGWAGLGIETAAERAGFARDRYGVEVLPEAYSGGKISAGEFDLICLNHVLEHLPEPLRLLKKLLDANLAANGVVYIEVPRADSLQTKIAGSNWIHWDIPRHLTHWTEPGLVKELKRIGYKKIAQRSFSLHLGVLGMLQALMSRFGYRKNLIIGLKRRRSPGLMVAVALLLPLALMAEVFSSLMEKGGITGLYLKRPE